MSNGHRQNSLDNLAHIANMSHELQILNQQVRDETGGQNNNYYNNIISNRRKVDQTQNGGSKGGKPKRMACVECRQQKSRCDAYEKQPAPCTRCAKKGLKCDLKSDYKRTYKRARIAQIEKEFSELKKNLTAAQVQELLNRVPSLSDSQSDFLEDSKPLPQPTSSSKGNQLVSDPKHGSNPPVGDLTADISLNWSSTISSAQNTFEPKSSIYSSEANISIPNTPSISRPQDQLDIGYQNTNSKNKLIVPEYLLICEPKKIDTITLSSETIKTLFTEYVDNYHPILPVVDILRGPEKIHKLCPALFWVIMVVSLRRYRNDMQKDLLMQLSPIIKDILAEITISPITNYSPTEDDDAFLNACSVYSVQAFLLYTFWPPITSSLSADSSWNTIGVAMFHAVRIGLHLPIVSPGQKEQVSEQKLEIAEEQARTWVVCNIVSQTIATSFGFPAFVQFDSSMWSVNRPDSMLGIPNSVKFMMEIAQFEDLVSKTLNSNPLDAYGLIDPTERLPLLKILLRKLNELELRLAKELPSDDGYRKFQLCSARVHLLTYYFMDTSRIADFELNSGLVKLYNSAISLIDHAQLCHAKDKTFAKYLPGVNVLNIWQAAFIIGKLAHSPMKTFLDLGSGKQSYLAAVSLAAKASILKHDIAYRSSGIMRSMWQLFRTLDEKKLTSLGIAVRTRMAASVFFDCLNLLKTQVGMIKLNSRHESNQDIAENEIEEEEEELSDEKEAQEDAILSDDEEGLGGATEEFHQKSGSQKSTPGSTSSKGKKHRSLSSTMDAESRARKIIRTIPLDPQPIPANSSKNSTFKNSIKSSNESSPRVVSDRGTPISQGGGSGPSSTNSEKISPGPSKAPPKRRPPQIIRKPSNLPLPLATNLQQLPHQLPQGPYQQIYQHQQQQVPQARHLQQLQMESSQPQETQVRNATGRTAANISSIALNDSIPGGLDNLELDMFDVNSDLIWKDVDSVMNEFGFHTQ
ncbi:uncharacterized protein PRCAT00002251001 [Priceomyces carsonii]|uniref:uncharacterized protein n=1 Tax=Priceomyces carsonii TaxID=28549 RepID=UPI002ED89575|nr:unnamed protein product [Priceomyces carsonii]